MARIGFLEKSIIAGIKKIILPNGLTVFLEELLEYRKVIFLVGVGFGVRDETEETGSISHFIEHSQYHSNRFRSADEILEDVEDGGAYIRAGTDFDSTIFYTRGYPRYLSKNVRIVYEAIMNFEYNEEEIEREREEILTEFKKSVDKPNEQYLEHLFIPALLRNTWAEKPILGTPKTAKRITREGIAAFKRKFFTPENMAIFVCGRFDEERVLKTIDKTFGRLKRQTFEAPEYKIDLRNRHREPPPKKRKGLELAYMALGYRVPGFNHPDALKFFLLESILSGGMSSRLPKTLRSGKGIGYDELESVYDDYGGIGVFYITAGGINPRKFKEAKIAILQELDNLKTNLVSKREFLRAKNLFLSREDDNLEKLGTRAKYLSDAYFRKSAFDPRNYRKYVGKISREALRRTAQKYFSDKYTLTALVPENFPLKTSEGN